MRKTQCDAVVLGEGEVTATALMEAIEKKRGFEDVPGIAYRDVSDIKITPRPPQIQDLDALPLYATICFLEYYV